MKHSKQKGNLGFSATIKEIHKLGMNVFVELGDYSKTDLIVEVGSTLVKIQVKYAAEKDDTATLPLRKCGPNGYKYKYTKDDVDLFSVYLPQRDKVIFIPSSVACQNANSFMIRFVKSENNQTQGIHFIDEFDKLSDVLNVVVNSIRSRSLNPA